MLQNQMPPLRINEFCKEKYSKSYRYNLIRQEAPMRTKHCCYHFMFSSTFPTVVKRAVSRSRRLWECCWGWGLSLSFRCCLAKGSSLNLLGRPLLISRMGRMFAWGWWATEAMRWGWALFGTHLHQSETAGQNCTFLHTGRILS